MMRRTVVVTLVLFIALSAMGQRRGGGQRPSGAGTTRTPEAGVAGGTTTGPMAQQPRQATVSSVNWPSLVVSPAGMSSRRSSSSRILGPPRTWQAVPVHTWIS